MPSVLEQIRSRKIVSAEIPQPSEFLRSTPPPDEFRLPPARRCFAENCPCPAVIWITIYDRDSPSPEFRCWGCDPPPSWSFVAARWLLAIPDGRWTWELFPRSNPNNLAVLGGDGGDGEGAAGHSSDWADREPNTITAADRSQITIFEPTGWNDLLRLTVKHGADEAWRMLQERTDLKLPVFSELELI